MKLTKEELEHFFRKASLPLTEGQSPQDWEQVLQASHEYAARFFWSPTIKKRLGCPPLLENESLKQAIKNYILH